MAKDTYATIHVKTSRERHNLALGKLRMQGTTMQAFMDHVLSLVADDAPLVHAILETLPDTPRLYSASSASRVS